MFLGLIRYYIAKNESKDNYYNDAGILIFPVNTHK